MIFNNVHVLLVEKQVLQELIKKEVDYRLGQEAEYLVGSISSTNDALDLTKSTVQRAERAIEKARKDNVLKTMDLVMYSDRHHHVHLL